MPLGRLHGLSIGPGDPELLHVDSYLGALQDARIHDGLRTLGQAPSGAQRIIWSWPCCGSTMGPYVACMASSVTTGSRYALPPSSTSAATRRAS